MESLDWQHLPFPGGLLDQPEWLMEDLMTISWRRRILEERIKGGGNVLPSAVNTQLVKRLLNGPGNSKAS
jgi:hypothetical protein